MLQSTRTSKTAKSFGICDLGVYPEVASAAVLDHLDRYVGDLKGFLAYGGLDRQARADCCNQSTSVHCKLPRLSIVPPSPSAPAPEPYALSRPHHFTKASIFFRRPRA